MLELSELAVYLKWTCEVFQCLGGQKKLLGFDLLGMNQYTSWLYLKCDHFNQSKISKFSLSTMVASQHSTF